MSGMFQDEGWNTGKLVDLRNLESTNCYCGNPAQVEGFFEEVPLDAVHLIDSGDYHYLTLFFLRKIKEPFQLLLIDNHPDDQSPAFAQDTLSCGGWVKTARETLPLMKAVHWNEKVEGNLPVYVSIDLDYLNYTEARTDWTQGEASFADLEALLPEERVIGVDICGGISAAKGGTPEDFRINVRTRKKLIDVI